MQVYTGIKSSSTSLSRVDTRRRIMEIEEGEVDDDFSSIVINFVI